MTKILSKIKTAAHSDDDFKVDGRGTCHGLDLGMPNWIKQ